MIRDFISIKICIFLKLVTRLRGKKSQRFRVVGHKMVNTKSYFFDVSGLMSDEKSVLMSDDVIVLMSDDVIVLVSDEKSALMSDDVSVLMSNGKSIFMSDDVSVLMSNGKS